MNLDIDSIEYTYGDEDTFTPRSGWVSVYKYAKGWTDGALRGKFIYRNRTTGKQIPQRVAEEYIAWYASQKAKPQSVSAPKIHRSESLEIVVDSDYERIVVGFSGRFGEINISVDGNKVSWEAENLPAVIEALTALNKEIEKDGS